MVTENNNLMPLEEPQVAYNEITGQITLLFKTKGETVFLLTFETYDNFVNFSYFIRNRVSVIGMHIRQLEIKRLAENEATIRALEIEQGLKHTETPEETYKRLEKGIDNILGGG